MAPSPHATDAVPFEDLLQQISEAKQKAAEIWEKEVEQQLRQESVTFRTGGATKAGTYTYRNPQQRILDNGPILPTKSFPGRLFHPAPGYLVADPEKLPERSIEVDAGGQRRSTTPRGGRARSFTSPRSPGGLPRIISLNDAEIVKGRPKLKTFP